MGLKELLYILRRGGFAEKDNKTVKKSAHLGKKKRPRTGGPKERKRHIIVQIEALPFGI